MGAGDVLRGVLDAAGSGGVVWQSGKLVVHARRGGVLWRGRSQSILSQTRDIRKRPSAVVSEGCWWRWAFKWSTTSEEKSGRSLSCRLGELHHSGRAPKRWAWTKRQPGQDISHADPPAIMERA